MPQPVRIQVWYIVYLLIYTISFKKTVKCTLPETKIAPGNGWLEDELSF